MNNAPALANDLLQFFDDGWTMATIPASAVQSLVRTYDDAAAVRKRQVPCWSPLLTTDADMSCNRSSPLPPRQRNSSNSSSSSSSSARPLLLHLDGGKVPPSPVYTSCAPPALCTRGRTDDITAMVDTILTAKKRISIAVMDFIPGSMGLWSTGPPVYWQVKYAH